MPDNETIRVEFSLNIGYANGDRTFVEEFDRETWESMDEDARMEHVRDWAAEHIDMDYREIN